MQNNFMESQTKTNLMRAFAGESQARNRYIFASDAASQQNMEALARMFKMTAAQEEQHAKIFFELMQEAAGTNVDINAGYPADVFSDLQKLLDFSAKSENEEFGVLYPDFARIAKDEGFTKAESKFTLIAQIENEHRQRFEYYAALMRDGKLFRSENTEERWMCLNCGHIHTASEAPLACPVCGVKQGYFVREREAAFTFGGIFAQ